MKRLFKIYTTCIATAVAAVTAYRLNFVLSLFMSLLSNLLFPLVTILIYGAGASFPGWNLFEVLLVQSLFLLSSGIAHLVWEGMLWSTMSHVREGTFEVILLKPLSPLYFMVVSSFNPHSFGTVIGSGVLFNVALYNTGMPSVMETVQFLILFAAGFCVVSGLNMIMAATSFKWVGNTRLSDIYESIMNFGKYPAGIFPQALRATTTFIIPVAMIGFAPASALLGRAESAMFIAVIPCVLFMLFGVWLYRLMIKQYEGVGG